jgi:hypothetical protein
MLATVAANAQNPTQYEWREYATDYFIVYYPVGQELTAYQALNIAEQVRVPLTDMYGPVDGKISIVIRDDEDYANGGAFFYDNKIEISATSLDYDMRSYTDWLWNVVTHELTHVFSIHNGMKAPRFMPMMYYQHIGYQEEKRDDVLVGYPNTMVSYPIPMFNIPSWLAEGAAQYQTRKAHFDRWDTHRDMIVRQAVLADELMTIDEMGVFVWNGRGNEMVYNHGYSLVSYIAEHYGDKKIRELLTSLSEPSVPTFGFACRNVLGITPDSLYHEWHDTLTAQYNSVVDSIGTQVTGTIFRAGGFVNTFPVWSPDGTRLAYVSNHGQDYSINSCFVANLTPEGWQWDGKGKYLRKNKKTLDNSLKDIKVPLERERTIASANAALDISLAGGIQSAPLWLDNWNVLFNRRMPQDSHGSHWWDMYRYVINKKDPREGTRIRITNNLRGTYPDLSPDKRWLVFVKNGDGLNNLFLMDRNDNSTKQLTFYDDGTRIYRPRWSPDGSHIAFTIHQGTEIDIALIDKNGDNFTRLISSSGQDRDPAWAPDGRFLYFASDITGISEIYRISQENGIIEQITKGVGGSFYPAPSPDDSLLAFSYYGTEGYEIHLLELGKTLGTPEPELFHRPVDVHPDTTYRRFRAEDSKPHQISTLDFSVMPRVVNDRGNMKFGGYLLKTEVTNKSDFLFGGAISPTNLDTDLFASFEYHQFIPTIFVEMYRQTRSVDKNENFMEEYGNIIRKRMFDLNELDFGLRYVYHDSHEFESRLIYSRYNAKLEFTDFRTGSQIYKQYYTYSQGFDLAFSYRYDAYARARDEIINPRGGRKVSARFDHFEDYFLNDFEYVGFLKEKYIKYPYNRYYLDWTERIPVPGTAKHTLLLRGQAIIIDHTIDRFYETQLGGPTQMRGYTFYSLSGRKTFMAQATYRFPLVYDLRQSFSIWYFNHLYAGVFADYGRAWNKRSMNFSLDGFKRDAGIELRLDAVSFYNFPTMIEFSAAYGFDDTWIRQFDSGTSSYYISRDDQDPWKFYFNILFGFQN